MPLQIKIKEKTPRGLNFSQTFFFGGGGFNKRKVYLHHILTLPVNSLEDYLLIHWSCMLF